MAISRAQLLKELLPGLNALFGLQYATYGEEHKEIYETEKSERSFEEETKLSGFSAAPSRTKVLPLLMTMRKKRSRLATTTKPSPWVSQSLKKRLKITCTTACLLATPRVWLVLWLTPSRLKLHPF